jgi:branched-chain amino acid transport system substrate-binding protein
MPIAFPPRGRLMAAAGLLALVTAACGSSGGGSLTTGAGASGSSGGGRTASGPGVTGDSVKIGVVTSTVGIAAPEFLNYAKGVEARVDQQNARGGVEGRKIVVTTADDGGSLTQDLTATKELVSGGVFAIVPGSPLFFTSAKYLNQAGIPVIGSGFDGLEWGQQPYTNMFSTVGIDAHYPQSTGTADFFKAHGATKVGAIGYQISPSSAMAAKGFDFSARSVGLKAPYLNTSIPFGSVDLTSASLAEKAAGVDGLFLDMDYNTNLAALTQAKQAGVDVKVAFLLTGYDQNLLNDATAVRNAQGAYFYTAGAPIELNTAATRNFTAALAKYEGIHGVPGFDIYEGWQDADLFIRGLQESGSQLTRSRFITRLQTVTDWDAGGLLPSPRNFTLADFGQPTQKSCEWIVQLQGSRFVPVPNGQLTCGTLIPNSNQS